MFDICSTDTCVSNSCLVLPNANLFFILSFIIFFASSLHDDKCVAIRKTLKNVGSHGASNLKGRIWLHVLLQKNHESMTSFIDADCSYITHVITAKPTHVQLNHDPKTTIVYRQTRPMIPFEFKKYMF